MTTTSTSSTTTTVPTPTSTGAVTWPLIDHVPSFRKAGLNIVAGVDYEPILDGTLRQTAASLTFTDERGLFAIAPERPDVPTDRIELAGVDGAASIWPFVITDMHELRVFVDPDAPGDCAAVVASEQPFAAFQVNGTVDDMLLVTDGSCHDWVMTEDNIVIGDLGDLSAGVRTFGILLTADPDAARVITIKSLALVDSAQPRPSASDLIRVTIAGRENLIAERSTDLSDDEMLSVLHVLRSDGSFFQVPVDEHGVYEFSRSDLTGNVKLYIEDYGLEYYVAQGPWIAPERITADLVIDATPVFGVADHSPSGSDTHRRPHELQIWNGSSGLENQQFHGVNWNNNLGYADRDRDPANPNGCRRVGWFGGSYVAAVQTRVDQKPGLIAEALLDTRDEGCWEIFTFGQNLFSVENHAANARTLVEDYGVTQLLFSVSALELCRLVDLVYTFDHDVSFETPLHWRWHEGAWLEPVTRREAELLELPDDFERREVCSFNDTQPGFSGIEQVFSKLGEMSDEMETWGDVEVTFMVMKDVLAGRFEKADLVLERCLATGHDCVLLPVPEFVLKPEDLAEVDYNPYLLRYVGDGHPNERGNQHIADGLVTAIIEQTERGRNAG